MPGNREYDDRPAAHVRGRGAQLNPPNRFEPVRLSVLGEYMDELARELPHGHQHPTHVYHDTARSIINRVDAPDMPFDWTINPYRGCEHGCIYCYARPTHENFGLSCGLDFETQIFAKLDAPALLRKELAHPKWTAEYILMSGVTDPYQPIERSLRITRDCLEIMAECRQPVAIITKHRMVTRDLDLLAQLAEHRAVRVTISLTTLDAHLARSMEPRASAPNARLEAIAKCAHAGIPTMAMIAPIIPGLNDQEIPALLRAAKESGAQSAAYTLLHMPHQVSELFLDWLQREWPLQASKVEARIRATRAGALSDERFGKRLRGTGAHAEQIQNLFRVHARKLGLDKAPPSLSGAAFLRPTLLGQPNQPGLF
ncbi:MAG: PA0069 family radical SAM protein [Phycisphaerales bacterium]|nr:PA0069 family radical SAM protein [Phycisphaerales bacterium]